MGARLGIEIIYDDSSISHTVVRCSQIGFHKFSLVFLLSMLNFDGSE